MLQPTREVPEHIPVKLNHRTDKSGGFFSYDTAFTSFKIRCLAALGIRLSGRRALARVRPMLWGKNSPAFARWFKLSVTAIRQGSTPSHLRVADRVEVS